MQIRKWTLFLVFALFFTSVSFAQNKSTDQIQFESDSYELSTKAKKQLDDMMGDLANATSYSFHLRGHTDFEGSLSYNEQLSKRRNQAVLSYLEKKGIPANSIQMQSYGELEPLDELKSESAKAINRRVEVLLNYKSVESVDEMLAHFAQQREQYFKVESQAGGEVIAEDGTIVRIPENAFVYEDGSPVAGDEIDLKVEEAIKASAMVFHQLNTTHGDHALATGGMIRVSATANGLPVTLADNKRLDIFVPTNNADPSMRLYDGHRDNDGAMVWDELKSPVKVVTAAEVHMEPVPFPSHIFTALDDVQFKMPEHPGKLLDLPLTAIPKMPKPSTPLMRKPYKPGPPQRQTAKAPKGLFAKMKYNEDKEQDRLDKQYEERLLKYNERMVQYEAAMLAYAENQKQYNAELEIIKAEYEIEKAAVIEERKHKIQAWLNRCYAFEAAHRVQERIVAYKKDISKETIHEKLYPNPKTKKPESFQFNISLKGLDYFARGEHMPPNIEPQYSKYLIAANNAASKLMYDLGIISTWSKIKKDYMTYQEMKAEKLRGENLQAVNSLNSAINYYGYQVSAPNFSRWCNIDTPIPMGQSLMAFENSRFSELFTFVPQSKMVNYFPMKKSKTAMFPAGQEVNYLAFRYVNDGVQLSQGKIRPRQRERVNLNFKESSLKEIEQAILALDI